MVQRMSYSCALCVAMLGTWLFGCDSGAASANGSVAPSDARRPVGAESVPTRNIAVDLEQVGEGLGRITDIEMVPGKPGVAVVTNQDGRAQLLRLDGAASKPAQPQGVLLELAVDATSEMGLLAVVFHPKYEQTGRLFAHYNPRGKQMTRVSEFNLPKEQLGRTQAKEQRVLLEVAQPYANHNGGELAFGPDGMLYVGLGDGGSSGDPQGNGQKLNTWLGKILRLDVDGPSLAPADNPFVGKPGAKPEIFAYGLRNPWKLSVLDDGRIIAADVGQDRFEEIDIIRAGDNLGWREREGAHCFAPPKGCRTGGYVDPVFEYGRDQGQSVTGGHVYKGQNIPALRGKYVFGDFASGRLWALDLPAEPRRGHASVIGKFPINPTAFARDERGELYVGDYGPGRVFKIVPRRNSSN